MRYSTRQGLRVGILFALFFGLSQALLHGAIGGIVSGLVSGALFGLIIGWLLRRKERVWAALREPYVAEGIVHEGPANCAIGPGYLVLTQKRLAWHPQQPALREKKIVIAREAIVKAERGSGIGAQLRIVVRTGETVQFLVTKRDEWLKLLNATLPQARVM